MYSDEGRPSGDNRKFSFEHPDLDSASNTLPQLSASQLLLESRRGSNELPTSPQSSVPLARSLSTKEVFRRGLLSWRLQRFYFVYCVSCCVLVSFLLLMTFIKGGVYLANPEGTDKWVHQIWEEVTEVTFGICLLTEMSLTLFIRGVMRCVTGVRQIDQWTCRAVWYAFDFFVVMLTVPSVVYGVHQVHCGLCDVSEHWLLLRIVLQPLRMCTVLRGTCRTYRMQYQVNELPVDFGALSPSKTPTAAEPSGIELAKRDT